MFPTDHEFEFISSSIVIALASQQPPQLVIYGTRAGVSRERMKCTPTCTNERDIRGDGLAQSWDHASTPAGKLLRTLSRLAFWGSPRAHPDHRWRRDPVEVYVRTTLSSVTLHSPDTRRNASKRPLGTELSSNHPNIHGPPRISWDWTCAH